MVTEPEAIQIATDFILKEKDQVSNLYGAKLINFDKKEKSHWAITFETKIEDDIVLDGPTIVLVNSKTKEVFFFPNLM